MSFFFFSVTWLGSLLVLLPAAIIVSAASGRLLAFPEKVFVTGGLISVSALAHLAKVLVARPRPEIVGDMLVSMPADLSFPSAHTAQATFFWLALALVITRGKPMAFSIPVWIAACSILSAVGCSRIYLGVHYVSDVVAGALLGAFWFFISRWFLQKIHSGDGYA